MACHKYLFIEKKMFYCIIFYLKVYNIALAAKIEGKSHMEF